MSKIAIIGAGASGLAAAIEAAGLGASVTVYEKKEQPGKKILATGNGKCNFLNEAQEINHFHSSDINKAARILSMVSYDELLNFFRGIGILPYSRNGYLYPLSGQAQSVHIALIEAAKTKGTEILCGKKVTKIKKQFSGIKVYLEDGTFDTFDSAIVSVGTNAGTREKDEAVRELLTPCGHSFIKFRPALCAARISSMMCSYWKGIRTRARISLYIDSTFISSEIGELMLTDYGISGIPVFQLSYAIPSALEENRSVHFIVDWMPELSKEELYNFIFELSLSFPEKTISSLLYGIIPQKLSDSIIIEILKSSECFRGIKAYRFFWKDLSEELRKTLCCRIKEFNITVNGVSPIENAQICSGGIPLDEVDENCQSLYIKNVYLTGECLDVNGDCGGYNLQWAWTTGIIAGRAAASKKGDY